MSLLDHLESKDPAYKNAYGTWCCPNNCGTELIPYENGMYCGVCEQPFSWAELAAADTED